MLHSSVLMGGSADMLLATFAVGKFSFSLIKGYCRIQFKIWVLNPLSSVEVESGLNRRKRYLKLSSGSRFETLNPCCYSVVMYSSLQN